MAQIQRLHKREIEFIDLYVGINMPRYKEMVREIFPDLSPVIKEIKAEFKNIYQKRELQLAIDHAQGRVFGTLARRLRNSNVRANLSWTIA